MSRARPVAILATRGAGGVVSASNHARTQNGHIRNDTRDHSRRIVGASFSPICRRNCAAHDRACTRVTPRNLHGKEGVSGSSPEEGFRKILSGDPFSSTETRRCRS